jgi:hypothetical protein
MPGAPRLRFARKGRTRSHLERQGSHRRPRVSFLQVVDLKRVQYNRVEVKGMATETITIQVDPEAARAYKAAPPADQRKMGALLGLWLKDAATAEPAALKRMMSDLSKKARDRGLTPEILENLLKEA